MTQVKELLGKPQRHDPQTKRRSGTKYLRTGQVVALIGVSRPTFYGMRKRGDFIEPDNIGTCDPRYRKDRVIAWLAQRVGAA